MKLVQISVLLIHLDFTVALQIHLVKLMDTIVKHVGPDDDPADNVFKRLTRFLTLIWASQFGNFECDKILRQIFTKMDSLDAE